MGIVRMLGWGGFCCKGGWGGIARTGGGLVRVWSGLMLSRRREMRCMLVVLRMRICSGRRRGADLVSTGLRWIVEKGVVLTGSQGFRRLSRDFTS